MGGVQLLLDEAEFLWAVALSESRHVPALPGSIQRGLVENRRLKSGYKLCGCLLVSETSILQD